MKMRKSQNSYCCTIFVTVSTIYPIVRCISLQAFYMQFLPDHVMPKYDHEMQVIHHSIIFTKLILVLSAFSYVPYMLKEFKSKIFNCSNLQDNKSILHVEFCAPSLTEISNDKDLTFDFEQIH